MKDTCTLCGAKLPSPIESFGPVDAPYCSGCWHGYSETAREMEIDGETASKFRHEQEREADNAVAYLSRLSPKKRAVQGATFLKAYYVATEASR